MNRYEFEDLISDYLDNNLNITKRKEFETYLKVNPDGKNKVDMIKSMMSSVKSLSSVKVSSVFMDNLNKKIEIEKNKPHNSKEMGKTYFGFTPIQGGLFSMSLIGFIWMGFLLLPNHTTQRLNNQINASPEVILQKTNGTPLLTNKNSNANDRIIEFKNSDTKDSTKVQKNKTKKSFSIDDKATFVKDQ